MKAVLEFDLDNVDDKIAHLKAIKSSDMASCLFEIYHNAKRHFKHRSLTEEQESILNEVFESIYNEIEGKNILDILE